MAKLQLRTNVPEIIALQFAQGKEVTSTLTGEPEVLFTLEDGRSWYVKPFVAAKVDALSLGKGEPFEVVKVEGANGKGFTYEVKHLMAQPPVPQQRPAVPRQSRAGQQHWEDDPTISHYVQAPARPSVTSTQPNGTAAQMVSQPIQQDISEATKTGMMGALCASIDYLVEAQTYATRKGLHVSFTGEDVRTIANTLFISMSKGGR